jgi:hypothetical protein
VRIADRSTAKHECFARTTVASRRCGVPAGVQLAAVIDNVGLGGVERQVGRRQPGLTKRPCVRRGCAAARSFERLPAQKERFQQARTFELAGGEHPPATATADSPFPASSDKSLPSWPWRGFITTRQHVATFVPPAGRVRPAPAGSGRAQCCADRRRLRRRLVVGPANHPPGGRAGRPASVAGILWEAKAPGKRPRDAQLAWVDRRRQVGLEAAWFNQGQLHDWSSPAVEPRESHVFEVWFLSYFTRRASHLNCP